MLNLKSDVEVILIAPEVEASLIIGNILPSNNLQFKVFYTINNSEEEWYVKEICLTC